MAAKHQKTLIDLKNKYSEIEKLAIATEIIDFIVERSQRGKDKNNKTFTPGYSKEYSESVEGKVAGKKEGATPNMTLSGDMLAALDYRPQENWGNKISIGYENGTDENSKADGNIRGTYGKQRANSKMSRDFLGITNKDLKNILRKYPQRGREGKTAEQIRSESVEEFLATEQAAKLISQGIITEDIVGTSN